MPVRFTSPSLGGQRESFLGRRAWEAGIHFRRLDADQWFVGSAVKEAAAPFGQPLYLNINSVDLTLAYGIAGRTTLTLTLPFSYGTHSRMYADGDRHVVSAAGLGDINLVASRLLLDPWRHPRQNIALGAGIKSPSGSNHERDDFYLADGSVTRRFVDQSIQLGDGGWGVMLQALAFRGLTTRISAYVNAAYLLSLRDTTDVPGPIPGQPAVPLAVPDVYSARAGFGYALAPESGLSVGLGARIEGIPQGDVVGGKDMGFRRPGYTLYAEPGGAWQRGAHALSLSMPLRVHQYFPQSTVDRQRNFPGGGDLANYLLFVSVTRRF